MKKLVLSLLMALILLAGIGTVFATEGNLGSLLISSNPNTDIFEDVDEDHWAFPSIKRWKIEGIINGYENNKYEPSNNVTRAEFMAMIDRIFIPVLTRDLSQYTDVREDAWYYNTLKKVLSLDIIQGRSETELAPDEPITRQEAMTIIYRLLRVAYGRTIDLNAYSDGKLVADWAKEPVAYMVKMGFVNGYEDGTLNPEGYITRAEIAKVLDKVIAKIISEEGTYDLSNVDGNVVIVSENVKLIGGKTNATIYVSPSVNASTISTKKTQLSKELVLLGAQNEEEEKKDENEDKKESGSSGGGGGSSIRVETHIINIKTDGETQKYTFEKASNTGNIVLNDKLTVSLNGEVIFENYAIKSKTLSDKVKEIINALDDDIVRETISTYKNNETVQEIGLKVLVAMGKAEDEYDDVMSGNKDTSTKDMAVRALQYLSTDDLLKLANVVAK